MLLVVLFATALMVLSDVGGWSDGTRYTVGGLLLVATIPLLLAWQDGLIELKPLQPRTPHSLAVLALLLTRASPARDALRHNASAEILEERAVPKLARWALEIGTTAALTVSAYGLIRLVAGLF